MPKPFRTLVLVIVVILALTSSQRRSGASLLSNAPPIAASQRKSTAGTRRDVLDRTAKLFVLAALCEAIIIFVIAPIQQAIFRRVDQAPNVSVSGLIDTATTGILFAIIVAIAVSIPDATHLKSEEIGRVLALTVLYITGSLLAWVIITTAGEFGWLNALFNSATVFTADELIFLLTLFGLGTITGITVSAFRSGIMTVSFAVKGLICLYVLDVAFVVIYTISTSVPVDSGTFVVLALPAVFATGALLGSMLGRVLLLTLTALAAAWSSDYAKWLPTALGYLIGYALITAVFAGWYSVINLFGSGDAFCLRSAVFYNDFKPNTVAPFCPQPNLLRFADYWFLSVTTFTTVGYGWNTVIPRTSLAQLAVALEPVVGFIWTVIVFAVVALRLVNSGAGPAIRKSK